MRWVGTEPFPGLVEVSFTDAAGVLRTFVDKPPVFDESDRLRPDASYPVAVEVPCEVLGGGGAAVVTVSTRPAGLETDDGLSEFEVFADQLTRTLPRT